MSIINNSIIAGASGQAGGAGESLSLRFNSGDSAYLSKTFASEGDRTTWTWSGWVKKSVATVSADQVIFGHYTNSSPFPLQFLRFDNGDKLRFEQYNSSAGSSNLITSQVFRDPSSWYHIVAVWDTTNATADSRHRLYVNGVQVTAFSTRSNPSLNLQGEINKPIEHGIGRYGYTNSNYFSGYLADVHFLDGITPGTTTRVVNGVTETILTDFGEFDATTGVWNPIEYTGSYGTNGFHLDFKNNSTVAALGTDAAGSNDWTPNNFSVTAGADNDSLYDHPTNGDPADDTGLGGEVKGNYCTLNPLAKSANTTLSNGNLEQTTTSSGGSLLGTFGMSSGKWYWEATNGISGNNGGYGIALSDIALADYPGQQANAWSYLYNGNKYNNATGTSYGSSFTAGDVIGVAFDADNGTLTFYKNGTSQGTAFTGLTSGPYLPLFGAAGSYSAANFGQRAFAYQNVGVDRPSADFQPLATPFLPTPTIADGSTAMDAVTYTGNNSTNTISGLGFSPDFVWTKGRTNASWHYLADIIRGGTKVLSSNDPAAEDTRNNHIQSWNSDGFTLGADGTSNGLNIPGIAWCWDGGSSNTTYTAGVTPGAGSISSVVRANPTAGFSIVTYTGNGTAGATVGHGLNVAPALIINKQRSGVNNWWTYHVSLGATKYVVLDLPNAAATSANTWNNTEPTSTVFSIGVTGVTNTNSATYVTYCFAPVEGYSAFGSYTGNGSSTGDGPFVYCGFRPKWVLIKGTTTSDDNWKIYDSSRSTNNVTDDFLTPDDPQVEITNNLNRLDFLSNGFKIRTEGTYALNVNNVPFIWAAFAENPFSIARAR